MLINRRVWQITMTERKTKHQISQNKKTNNENYYNETAELFHSCQEVKYNNENHNRRKNRRGKDQKVDNDID